MKTPRAGLVATAIPLILTSLPLTAAELPLTAAELPFNAPATEQAKESAPLLHQAARALREAPSTAALRLTNGQQIANLWLFPTADEDTVFARYNVTSNPQAASGATGSTTEHLTVLTVRGDHIVESRDLTSVSAELPANAAAKLHWSAAFGTGNAAHADLTADGKAINSSHGVPSEPHWTASIGTGAATSSTTAAHGAKQSASSGTQPVAATNHWTSRIGTGHAFDSIS